MVRAVVFSAVVASTSGTSIEFLICEQKFVAAFVCTLLVILWRDTTSLRPFEKPEPIVVRPCLLVQCNAFAKTHILMCGERSFCIVALSTATDTILNRICDVIIDPIDAVDSTSVALVAVEAWRHE